ncbi:substrate-binding domain-containing protein [Streptococcus caviae]|uniref:substrate-binding domain-containing protein n=1 Tax=Streptococcus sp. 'caviae' TaxID=1915004 RepID=UPI00094B8704|nr:substrate-binding domain-containing protein [Streptococcus sp. 'caviae']OLN82549.1 phosphate ABC transporter substrate-binding protein [Streptococcus sp. 'caviae']
MKKLKFISALALTGLAGLALLSACGNSNSKSSSQTINVVSREDGSGTRGAFVELFGIEEEKSNGEKVDLTTDKAAVTNSTAVMLTTVAGDENAIGYVSMGSLDDKVKVVSIDGTKATIAHVKDGSYKISRPFNIVTHDKISDVAQDFISYIMSSDGQKVVENNGYIAVDGKEKYKSSVDSGKLVISGSSSVTPVMEKLKEAYLKVNSKVTIEIQQSDSSTGITNTIDKTCDIGMASRELEKSETSKGVKSQKIALDGIAIIVNKGNSVKELTSKQVKAIFKGDTTKWDDVLSK